MPDNLPVLTGGLFPTKLDRQVAKALDQVNAQSIVAKRNDSARIERITETTQHGMTAVSHLAAVQAALSQATPHAAERIHAVAVAGAIGIIGVVHDAGRGA